MSPAALAAVAGLAISLAGTGLLIPLLRRRGVLDRPNARSSHSLPTPRGGGLAPVAAVIVIWAAPTAGGWAPASLGAVLAGAALLAAVSAIDDLRGLSPLPRLAAQGVAVAAGMLALMPQVAAAGVLPGWLGAAAAALLWLWWINAFNFMDGIDGLAGSEAAAIGLGLAAFAPGGLPPALPAALLGAALGFLVWNWAPARVFLGDVGSIPLGYLSGFVLLQAAAAGAWPLALILPLYFLADAGLTLARRALRGERVWQAHREHLYQRAVQRGLGHAAVVRRVIVADLLLILCAALAEAGWTVTALAAAVLTTALLLIVLMRAR